MTSHGALENTAKLESDLWEAAANLRANSKLTDWSLTPGRYVGVAPAEVDDDFDFEQAIGDIHVEIKDLKHEAAALAKRIQKNFEGLGV